LFELIQQEKIDNSLAKRKEELVSVSYLLGTKKLHFGVEQLLDQGGCWELHFVEMIVWE